MVNKGPIDKDETFNNAEKSAETGKVLKLAYCFHVCIGRAYVIKEIIV